MLALLKRQRKEHDTANGVGSSLAARTLRRELQQQAVAQRWQWRKTHGYLRNQEMNLLYELKQLLTSQHMLGLGYGAALSETKLQPKKETAPEQRCPFRTNSLGAENSNATTNITLGETLPKPKSLVADEMHRGRNSECSHWVGDLQTQGFQDSTNSLGCSCETPFARFASLLWCCLSILHLVKEWRLTGVDASVSCSTSDHTSQATPKSADHVADNSHCGNTPHSNQQEYSSYSNLCQEARCIFDLVSYTFQDEGVTLDEACAAASAEAAAAVAELRAEGIISQHAAAPMRERRSRQFNLQGGQQSLTDAEDEILCGVAPQVQAAAEAASAVANILNQRESKAFQESGTRDQTPELTPHGWSLAFADDKAPSSSLGSTMTLESCSKKVSTDKWCTMRSSWRYVLEDYSKKLLELEEKRTIQLQHYRHAACRFKGNLRQAVSGLLAKPSHGQRTTETHEKPKTKQHVKQGESSAIGYALESYPGGIGCDGSFTDTGTKPHVSEETKCPNSADSPTPPAQKAKLSSSCVIVEQQRLRDEGGSGETQNAVTSALVAVRWLWIAARSEGGEVQEQTQSLLQRLQLAFPSADLCDIKRVVGAMQDLILLHQRRLTYMRVWDRERESALVAVLQKLDKLTSEFRELAEKHRASAILGERRSRLAVKLRQQRKIRDEKEFRLAALKRQVREAKHAQAVEQARREKLRREKDRELLADFRERKLLEAQLKKELSAQKARASDEPLHLRCLKAARVARRQEQHNLKVFEQQLDRQERQLQAEFLKHRLIALAEKLKPSVERHPERLLRHTKSFQAYAEAEAERRQLHEPQKHRLNSFAVEHSYSEAHLMQDLRFRLSTALAEGQLANSHDAQELLLNMSRPIGKRQLLFM